MSKRSFILTVLFFIVVMAIAVIWTKSVRKEDGGYVTPRIEQHVFSEPTDESSLAAAMQEEVRLNSYSNLSVPTYLTKIADTYFIVDCYHDQVIYHDNLTEPLCQWSVMTDEIDKGHTLASDGIVYLIDDTENNRILVFQKRDNRFLHTQTFSDIGNRPHYIVYDEKTATFYAWSSMSGEIYLDDAWYMIEHRLPGHSIWRFQIVDNAITAVETVY